MRNPVVIGYYRTHEYYRPSPDFLFTNEEYGKVPTVKISQYIFLMLVNTVLFSACSKYKYGVRGCAVESPGDCGEVTAKFTDKSACQNYANYSSSHCSPDNEYARLKEGDPVCVKVISSRSKGECIDL